MLKKTSFPPNFNNKTTPVAVKYTTYTHPRYLIKTTYQRRPL
jgi:hypothetical protein